MGSQGILSENVTSILLFGASFAAVFLITNRFSRKARNGYSIPRGPTGIPFFGNALFLKENDGFLNQLLSLSKEYDSVYSIYIGRKLQVVVNGWKHIKDLTVKSGLDFGDRPVNIPFYEVNPNRLGIFDTRADATWKHQRNFALSTLRGMGFGKVSLEPLVQTEIDQTIAFLLKSKGSPVNPRSAFVVGASNVIGNLVFKHRIDHGSETADDLMKNVRDVMVYDEGVLIYFFPSLWFLIKRFGKWPKALQAWENLRKFFHDEVLVHQERIDASTGEAEIHDFLDAYLVHRQTDPDTYTLEALYFTLLDLFTGGIDTTSTTLTWAVIYLVTNPDIQDKIHGEVMREVGTGRVSMSHRAGLPYTQAALLEVQRLASIAPLIPRQACTDVTLAGHRFPKGTEFLINLWSLHHDPEVWPDPERFDPDRFLNPDGSLKQRPDNFLPFSAGKRNCMGEQLAKMELFLFFTSIVQNLKFTLPAGTAPPSYDGKFELIRNPRDYQVCISPW